MTQDIIYRPAVAADIEPAYAVFRRSLFDYLFRLAIVDEATAKDPPIAEAWKRQSAWIEHLWKTAAENWVAEDTAGNILGWALSVARGDHLELTHFFVEPGVQAKGIGRGLIVRAFPDGRARHKTIIATQDTRALSLYLRSGVGYITTSAEFIVTPRRSEVASGFVFEPLQADGKAIDEIAALEQTVLGYRRDVDTKFLLGLRPAWLVRKGGAVAGFAFAAQPKVPDAGGPPPACGPIAATDPSDLPAMIDHVIDAAAQAGIAELSFVVPLINRVAVDHLLRQGGKIDPFYLKILANDDSMRLDRWVHTTPLFIM